ncbi:MAG: EAL domain-containing protein [Halieaceae bacterium]|nr:EAL domain-containing protein [Halieaceae bacterium]
MSQADDQHRDSSHAELIDVEINKQRQVIYTLWFIFMSILFGFSVLALVEGRSNWGMVLLASTVVCAVYLLHERHFNKDVPGLTIPNLTLLLLVAVLTITGAVEKTGPLFIYAIVIMGVLTNNFRGAALFGASTIGLLLLLLFVFDDMLLQVEYSQAMKTRLIYSMTVLLWVALIGSYYQDEAQEVTHRLHQRVHRLAYFDSLTGLTNRSSFRRWLQRSLERAQRDGSGLALIYIDLDNFKQVNDRFGHSMGDRVLATFGERLSDCLRPTDNSLHMVSTEDIARLAGDEFIVILQDVSEPRVAELVARRILAMFENGFLVDDLNTSVTCSIGIAFVEAGQESAETLLNNADAAMYKSKQKGKNRYEFFSEKIAAVMQERHRIEAGLQDALASNGFNLVFMPIYEANTLRIVGFETLLRCETPELQGIGPDRFIPVAETTGQIKRIDLWVLENSMAALRTLCAEQGFEGIMCVNISALELQNGEFPAQVDYVLRKYGIRPAQVELELTETSEALYDQASLSTLEELKSLGVGLSLDDFGTGYTAFNQLVKFPVDCLKIDRSFVNSLFQQDNAKGQMVEIIKNLAGLYNLRVVAEGVETRQQLAYLQQIGCNWLQGYLLSQPLSYQDFSDLLREHTPLSHHAEAASGLTRTINAWR